ncbi:hypothetical protein BC832DRAFT_423858 [Gaertneriomyces semiglobifer]|nr:hypothetical protein BC832DRAFT_423858 [Gaertneriomyces semiglobifer]
MQGQRRRSDRLRQSENHPQTNSLITDVFTTKKRTRQTHTEPKKTASVTKRPPTPVLRESTVQIEVDAASCGVVRTALVQIGSSQSTSPDLFDTRAASDRSAVNHASAEEYLSRPIDDSWDSDTSRKRKRHSPLDNENTPVMTEVHPETFADAVKPVRQQSNGTHHKEMLGIDSQSSGFMKASAFAGMIPSIPAFSNLFKDAPSATKAAPLSKPNRSTSSMWQADTVAVTRNGDAFSFNRPEFSTSTVSAVDLLDDAYFERLLKSVPEDTDVMQDVTRNRPEVGNATTATRTISDVKNEEGYSANDLVLQEMEFLENNLYFFEDDSELRLDGSMDGNEPNSRVSADLFDVEEWDASRTLKLEAGSSFLQHSDPVKGQVELELMSEDDMIEMDKSDSLALSNAIYGLPDNVINAFTRVGTMSLYKWQSECLLLDGVLDGTKNLLYSAPTSAGKSMVADILMLKKVLETRRKAIMIVPFVAIAAERTTYMKALMESQPVKVVGYYSDVGSSSFEDADIAYCTPEKANGLLNKLLEDGKHEDIGIVVVDELHMAGDPHRGYLLELLLTKLKYVMRDRLQLVGMSATLPNLETFQRWLDAHLYVTIERPVPLTEFIKFRNAIYDSNGHLLKKLQSNIPSDADLLAPLVQPVIDERGSVLIFCNSKNRCETTAKFLAPLLHSEVEGDMQQKRDDAAKELTRAPGSPDELLSDLVKRGVAFHHSGLTTEERGIIEDAFRSGLIRVLTCTSTLALGVNLPARRVIFRNMKMGISSLSARDYNQMKGRAGRKGMDPFGECFIMCATDREFDEAKQLIRATLQPVTSCLLTELKGMKRALLEIIVSGIARTWSDVQAYISQTLLYAEQAEYRGELQRCVESAMDFLIANGFISRRQPVEMKSADCIFKPELLGAAAVSSSLSPEEALIVYKELDKAREGFVLKDELHTVYHVTPPYLIESIRIEWNILTEIYNSHSREIHRKVAELVGIKEYVLYTQRQNRLKPEEKRVYDRFYIALILHDLVQEKPYHEVLYKYPGISRGQLQTLQTQAGTFAGMVKTFCEKLGWQSLAMIVSNFHHRLNFGVSAELLELIQVPEIGASRARALWNAGYKTVASLSCISPDEIFEALQKSTPSYGQDKEFQRRIVMRAARTISEGAMKIIQEQIDEAAKETERKRQLLAKAREINSPASAPSPRSEDRSPAVHVNKSPGLKRSPAADRTSRPASSTLRGTDEAAIMAPSAKKTQLPAACAALPGRGQFTFSITDATGDEMVFERFLKEWAQQRLFAWRIVCTEPRSTIKALAICWQPDSVWFLDPQHSVFSWPAIQEVFNKRSVKVAFDCKRQLKCLMQCGLTVKGDLMDPQVAAWCLDPESERRDLKTMFRTIYPRLALNEHGDQRSLCCREVLQTSMLMDHMRLRLSKEGLFDHFASVEMKIAPVLAQMEAVGVGLVDADLKDCRSLYEKRLRQLEEEAERLAGFRIDLRNSNQVAGVLFDTLQLSYENAIEGTSVCEKQKAQRSLGKAVKRSTCKEVLLNLRDLHRFPNIVLEHRRIDKLLAICMDPLETASVQNDAFGMSRVHCTYDTHTYTGRVQTVSPNLQNVPKPQHVDLESQCTEANVRNAFHSATGMVFISADYFQLELRIIAHMSGDQDLIAIMKSGSDLFHSVARRLYGDSVTEITYSQRNRAKAISYGVIYGMGARTLAEDLEVTVAEADAFINDFNMAYPGIAAFKDRVIARCHEQGYVETILGRKRFLPHIHSKNASDRAQAERQALNTTIQGSAADLVKLGMIFIEKAFRHRGWSRWILNGDQKAVDVPHLVLQIHDELLFEVPEMLVDQVREIIVDCMSHTYEMSVPLPVRLKTGKQWGSLTETK